MRFVMWMAICLMILSAVAVDAQNLLRDPSFETWDGWTRAGTHAGSSNIWNSTWIGWTDGHTGSNYPIATKHGDYEPKDDTTPVDVFMYQNITDIAPGNYEASMWFKTGGTGSKWDGGDGEAQWTDFRVYYWADNACTQMVYASIAPSIDLVTPQWTKMKIQFTVPANGSVKALSFYAFTRLTDRWDGAWVAWDDAYLGPVPVYNPSTIAEVKTIPDGEMVQVTGKVVTKFWSGEYYVEEPNRQAGIAVVGGAPSVSAGQVVTVNGKIATRGVERYIATTTSPNVTDTITPLKPVGMNGRSLAGGPRDVNILQDPGFDTWEGWNRIADYAAGTFWHSSWLNWTDGHSGSSYNTATKQWAQEPWDDTTPVLAKMYQNCYPVLPGEYEASIWYRTGGDGSKWDGPGGVDQYFQFHVYYWADQDMTQMLYAQQSDKIEAKVGRWVKLSKTFPVPAEVQALSFYVLCQNVDNWDESRIDFDDAFLGYHLPQVGMPVDGLLVRAWGKVVEVEAGDTPTWFRLTDGSGQVTKVLLAGTAVTIPSVGSDVVVTGISGMGTDGNATLKISVPSDVQ